MRIALSGSFNVTFPEKVPLEPLGRYSHNEDKDDRECPRIRIEDTKVIEPEESEEQNKGQEP
jgi:hypothetical protein